MEQNQQQDQKLEEEKFDEKIEEVKVVQGLTAKVPPPPHKFKEIKKLVRPEFEKNPEKFYPTQIFAKLGYSRSRCPKCQAYFWRHTEKKEFCGDSQYLSEKILKGASGPTRSSGKAPESARRARRSPTRRPGKASRSP